MSKPRHPCFISFRHVGNCEKFVRTFRDALKEELENSFGKFKDAEGPFLDEDRMTSAVYLENTIAEAICNSVCMIVIYLPAYFSEEYPYCAREFKAMQLLEMQRRQMLPPGAVTDSFIIPVFFRDKERFKKLKLVTNDKYDFQKLSLLSNMKNNQQFKSMIIELGQDVYKRYEVFTQNHVNPWGNCQNHQLPSIQEVKQLLQSESEQFVNRNG